MAGMIDLRFPQPGRTSSMIKDPEKAKDCLVTVCRAIFIRNFLLAWVLSRFGDDFRQDKRSTHCVRM